ncbi:hypothetical protein CERSUDRAFT_99988 [Gelatoporia subvermispora B]|uniref:Uncharacterized protein n=1 Tax=Ceriporiopsis subvermispora (strain B) TaxID=914234 RepID=M2P8N0_CERS8|nr:hypothetical protein CERSUDRAFT_99988 [Gelatoporia subvermispora B]
MYNQPYLDGVVHEVLRLHPTATESHRVAKVDIDNVVPLSIPLSMLDGMHDDCLHVARQDGHYPIRFVNCSDALWGADAK